ncbi:MAG: M4 family metallopeptidase [Saprospiraceae bacterium]|nr:M4 family metallopeptidase [Saprospiraceae bacterium]MBK7523377.1 M4 family metallopeptidase [Saprospiraceae bacterium]MBK8371633.1 M4 family metallopeptidase [Saprospiraceae bacterium]MBK8853518.1 M4 family metallopeptidase [Saprospiraceae bacterium]MBK9041906.1 M4 family metallopeptidase [Saprospiraceae bacterium]
MRIFISCFIIFLLPCLAMSQEKIAVTSPVFYPDKEVEVKDFFKEFGEKLGLSPQCKMMVEKNSFSKPVKNHIKYHQYYNNIPVYGHSLVLHKKDGNIDHATGTIAQNLKIEDIEIADKDFFLQKVLSYFLTDETGKVLECDDISVIHFRKIIVDKKYPQKSKKYCLAVDIHVMSEKLGKNYQYILEAGNGNIIFEQDLVCNMFPKGTAPSYHYGTVEIETEQVSSNKFQLKDVTRGNGNTTFLNVNNIDVLLSDDDNIWERPTDVKLGNVAFDAHYCTMKFYDYLVDKFDYSGINGNGRSMIARTNINNGADLVNAFWNNQNAAFGNGNCHYHPLTTFSIVGHEFAHGITSENAKLVYSGESGAINEAFSDIIGKSFQYEMEPQKYEWTVGHELVATRFAKPLRSMEDPTLFSNPKMYKGKHWRDGGSVHSNSGVLNHWFYLLIEGGAGKNEVDTAYNVTPVAWQDVLDLVFLCQTSYLQTNSTYPELFEFSKLACESLFGKNSQQYNSIIEAWKAVGLPWEATPIANFDDLSVTAKIKNDPNNSFTCYKNEYPEINLFITNKGTIFYPAGTSLKFNITRNSMVVERQILLPTDLAPDSMRMISIPDYQLIDKTEYFSLEINLINNDHIQSNNRFYLYFQNYATDGIDLQPSSISNKEVECFDGTINFTVRVRNNSCFTVPAGTIVKLEMFDLDKNEKFPFEHTITQMLAPRNETSIQANLPFDWKSINYSAAIQSSEDIYPTNNELLYTVAEKGVITSSKKYTFDDQTFEEDFKHNSSQPKFLFEDEYYFRTKSTFSSNNSPCIDISENFKAVNSGLAQYTVAEACLDLRGFNEPKLQFDMRQFRSDFYASFPELDGNSTILKIECISSEINFLPELIKNQEVNTTIGYEYELPKGFKGRFRIVAFTSRHDGTSSVNAKNDVILLDNIEISDVVSSYDDEMYHDIRVFPNPVGEMFFVKSYKEEINRIEIKDITGKVIWRHSCGSGIKDIDIPSHFMLPGCYILEVHSPSHLYAVKLIR